MAPELRLFRLWMLYLAFAVIVFGGFYAIAIPRHNIYGILFLAIGLPICTFGFALLAGSFVSGPIDDTGIFNCHPGGEKIMWDQVKSIRRRWPFVIVRGQKGSTAILPTGSLMNNKAEFLQYLSSLSGSTPRAKELRNAT
jgi:hypothetical protein